MRDNSRLITQMIGNPVEKSEQWEGYQPIYFEQRIGNNGNVFIIQDAGKNGWDIYFNGRSNQIASAIQQFCTETGCEVPKLEDQVKMEE